MGAVEGDVLEFTEISELEYRIELLRTNTVSESKGIVINLARGWTSVEHYG
jgi:hypothetical protein